MFLVPIYMSMCVNGIEIIYTFEDVINSEMASEVPNYCRPYHDYYLRQRPLGQSLSMLIGCLSVCLSVSDCGMNDLHSMGRNVVHQLLLIIIMLGTKRSTTPPPP